MPVLITYFVHGTTIDNEKKISSGWHDGKITRPNSTPIVNNILDYKPNFV